MRVADDAEEQPAPALLRATTMLIVKSDELATVGARLGPTVAAAYATVAVQDPESRRTSVRNLGATPPRAIPEIHAQIDQLERWTLAKPQTATQLRTIVGRLNRMVKGDGFAYHSLGDGQGVLDPEGTIQAMASVGDIFCVLCASAENDGLAKALGGLPSTCCIAPAHCRVSFRTGSRGWYDDWFISVVRPGNCDKAKADVVQMVDRKRITGEQCDAIVGWLDALATQLRGSRPIHIVPR